MVNCDVTGTVCHFISPFLYLLCSGKFSKLFRMGPFFQSIPWHKYLLIQYTLLVLLGLLYLETLCLLTVNRGGYIFILSEFLLLTDSSVLSLGSLGGASLFLALVFFLAVNVCLGAVG